MSFEEPQGPGDHQGFGTSEELPNRYSEGMSRKTQNGLIGVALVMAILYLFYSIATTGYEDAQVRNQEPIQRPQSQPFESWGAVEESKRFNDDVVRDDSGMPRPDQPRREQGRTDTYPGDIYVP